MVFVNPGKFQAIMNIDQYEINGVSKFKYFAIEVAGKLHFSHHIICKSSSKQIKAIIILKIFLI